MSFATPTVDVYVPGTTLGLGNVNASTINIGQPGTTVNVGGTMAVTNSVTTPSCTMSSLTTGNLIISPFSGNVAFNQFSAINASFNSLNSSNILIGPYPISGTFTDLNVTNASVTTLNVTNASITNASVTNASVSTLNVTNFLITPLPRYQSGFISNPVATTPTLQSFTTITTVSPPLVFLTYDYGLGSTNIINVGVVGIQGSANAWTGFYYLTSSSGTASSKLYWLVTN